MTKNMKHKTVPYFWLDESKEVFQCRGPFKGKHCICPALNGVCPVCDMSGGEP